MSQNSPTENQSRIIWFALTALAIAALVGVGAGLIWGIGKILNLLSPVLWPLAIGAVVAYLLDPLINWLESRKIPRRRAILLVFIAAFASAGAILANVVPQLVSETGQLASNIPRYTEQMQKRIENWTSRAQFHSNPAPAQTTNSPEIEDAATNPSAAAPNAPQINDEIISSATGWLQQALPKIGSWFLSQLAKATALIKVVIALVLIPIYAFYFLREKRGIKSHWTEYLPIRHSHTKDEIIFILTAINQYMIAFFRGQVLVALCNGVLYTIGFLIIGLDYAFLLGFLAALLTMIPFLGAIMNCIIALVLTTVQYSDWTHPLMALCVVVVAQTLESLFISPKIMGNRVGLHPLVIIIAVMVGTTLFGGLLGGILAIPLAAALRVIILHYAWKKREASIKPNAPTLKDA
jgi:predicted PurR-regulated permease PerM